MKLFGKGAFDLGGGGGAPPLADGGGLVEIGGHTAVDTDVIASTDFVRAIIGGLLWKPAQHVVARTNVALSGTGPIDGEALTAGMRVLCVAQTDGRQNGPWIVASPAWVRPDDVASQMMSSAGFPVVTGAGHITGEIWYITTPDTIVPDVTEVSLSTVTMTTTLDGVTDITVQGKAMSRAASYAAMRTLLSLGDSATKNVGTSTGTVAAGDDARMTNARSPTAHKSSHATGGSDALTAADVGAAQAPGALSVSYDLTGAVYDYTTDAQWTPSGVSVQREDIGMMSRNGFRFWGRGRSKGTLQGVATGLRLQATSTTDGNQAYPSSDAGLSIFAELPPVLELELDVVLNIVLAAKATAGFFAMRAGIMNVGMTPLQHLAYYSQSAATYNGNWTREHGFGAGTTGTQTQVTTALSAPRAFRLRWRGGVYEMWEGASLGALSRVSAGVPATYAQALQQRIFTVGVSNSQGAALAGSYAELTSIAWRDRWSS